MAFKKQQPQTTQLTTSEISKMEKNFETFEQLVSRIKRDEARIPLMKFCSDYKSRLSVIPASSNLQYVGAYYGGLLQHSLNVVKTMKHLNELFESGISIDSIIITGLFHDIGKMGNETKDYYNEQTSAWHRDKGIMFEINPDLPYMPVAQRTLWWLNKYQCQLTEEEVSALCSLSDIGQSMTAANFYHQPMLTVILQTAVRVCCVQGTDKKSVLE